MAKLLLLDLDGTIREPLSGKEFINNPLDQRIVEGADKALKKYISQGWIAIGISNQGGVEAGYKTIESCIVEQYYTMQLFLPNLSGILFCPDLNGLKIERIIDADISESGIFRDKESDCKKFNERYQGTYRKPDPGMIRYAIQMTMIPPIDCLMVGDRSEDEQAAANAGIDFMWAHEWRKTD